MAGCKNSIPLNGVASFNSFVSFKSEDMFFICPDGQYWATPGRAMLVNRVDLLLKESYNWAMYIYRDKGRAVCDH